MLDLLIVHELDLLIVQDQIEVRDAGSTLSTATADRKKFKQRQIKTKVTSEMKVAPRWLHR